MNQQNPLDSFSKREILISVCILLGSIVLVDFILPRPILILGGIIIGTTMCIFLLGYAFYVYKDRIPRRLGATPIAVLFLIPVAIGAGFIWYFNIVFTLVGGIIFLALLLFVSIYWIVIPLSMFQHYQEQLRTVDIDEWPAVTVLIPAYNEEGYIGPCIDSLLKSTYPKNRLQIVVIDDGSTDETLREAQQRESDRITVVHKENGGKHSALNYGLEYVETDLVVSVDADSLIAPDAITHLVKIYTFHNEPCAVAGNVKIRHTESRLERIQALEYIISINLFRRAQDQLGLVSVVPGCLGLFERETVELVGGFSGDTVTEDFDLTIELLKQGHKVHYSGNAIAYTEAPKTLRGLYNQRLRWLSGTVQTLLKHKEIVSNTNFGLLHVVLTPYMWLSVIGSPILGFVVLGAIIWMSVTGSFLQVLSLLILFLLLELLFGLTALLIEDSNEGANFRLLAYTPLMVIGYKQLQDLIMIKSLLTVILNRQVGWTKAGRNRQKQS